jgi:hypothetical protein
VISGSRVSLGGRPRALRDNGGCFALGALGEALRPTNVARASPGVFATQQTPIRLHGHREREVKALATLWRSRRDARAAELRGLCCCRTHVPLRAEHAENARSSPAFFKISKTMTSPRFAHCWSIRSLRMKGTRERGNLVEPGPTPRISPLTARKPQVPSVGAGLTTTTVSACAWRRRVRKTAVNRDATLRAAAARGSLSTRVSGVARPNWRDHRCGELAPRGSSPLKSSEPRLSRLITASHLAA